MSLDLPSTSSREDRLIVAACRREAVDVAEIHELAAPFASVSGAHALIDRTFAHRVPGLVLHSLDRYGWFDRVEQEAATVFRTHLSRLRWRSGLFSLELRRLAGALVTSGIHCVVLKGASLGPSVYARATERFFADLDVLVDPERAEEAIDLLLASGYTNPWPLEAVRGYRKYHYHLPLARPDGMILELHWDLVKPERPYDLDPYGVIERSIPIPGVPEPLRMPCVEDQILHAVVQQLQDGFTQLSRSVDLDRLVATGRVDWEALVARARECALGPALAYAMQVSRHLLATDCPAEVVDTLAPGVLARTHLSLLDPVASSLDRRFVDHPAVYNLLKLWLTQSDRSRLAILAGLAHQMADHEPLKAPWALSRKPRPRGRRLVELAKLTVSQFAIYLKALPDLPSDRFRAQMRFWSTQR